MAQYETESVSNSYALDFLQLEAYTEYDHSPPFPSLVSAWGREGKRDNESIMIRRYFGFTEGSCIRNARAQVDTAGTENGDCNTVGARFVLPTKRIRPLFCWDKKHL